MNGALTFPQFEIKSAKFIYRTEEPSNVKKGRQSKASDRHSNSPSLIVSGVALLLFILGANGSRKKGGARRILSNPGDPTLELDPVFTAQLKVQLQQRIEKELAGNPNQSKAHDWEHLDRVRKRALRIADRLEKKGNRSDDGGLLIDREALELAALLHDVDQPYDRKEDHAELSAIRANRILTDLGFSGRTIEKVQAIIREHSSKGGEPPESCEGKILFDADKLDGIGIIGIMRVHRLCQQMGRSPEEMIEWYRTKVDRAIPMIQTEIGRSMGEGDLEITRKFIAEVIRHSQEGIITSEVIDTIVSDLESEL